MDREQVREEVARDYKITGASHVVKPEMDVLEWLITERLARREAEAERDGLKAEQEKLIWNLGGISVLATSRTPQGFSGDWARAALWDTLKLVQDYVALEAKAASEYRRGWDEAIEAVRNRLEFMVGCLPDVAMVAREQLKAAISMLKMLSPPEQEVKP